MQSFMAGETVLRASSILEAAVGVLGMSPDTMVINLLR